jgi:hypothetical protein
MKAALGVVVDLCFNNKKLLYVDRELAVTSCSKLDFDVTGSLPGQRYFDCLSKKNPHCRLITRLGGVR